VLSFDRWIRGLKNAMDKTLRDPQHIAPAGLTPAAVERLWRAFLGGAPKVQFYSAILRRGKRLDYSGLTTVA
jgi:hypothetical protein